MDRQVDVIREVRRQVAVGGTAAAVLYGVRELGLAYTQARDLVRRVRSGIVTGRTRSRFEQNLGGQNLAGKFEEAAQPMSKRQRTMGVPNVIPGGIGHYQGSFRKTSLPIGENNLYRFGYTGEQEIFGQISNSDVQYIGFQSVTLDMVVQAISAALLRMIWWRHFRANYVSLADTMYIDPGAPVPGLKTPHVKHIIMKFRMRLQSGSWSAQESVSPLITTTTTLNDLVNWLVGLFLSAQGGADEGNLGWDITGYQFVYSYTDDGLTYPEVSTVYNIEEQRLNLSVLTSLKLQNVTRGESEGAGAQFVRDSIHANPVSGRCYNFKGIFPVVEGNHHDDVGTFTQTFMTYDINDSYGLIIPNAGVVGEYRALPNPQIFSNIIGCQTGLHLEPGEIKTDVVRFRYNGKLQELLKGLSYHRPGSNNNSILPNNRMGTCKLFAFEKMVPSLVDVVEMNYSIDRYIKCVFEPDYQVTSVRKEVIGPIVFDRLIDAPTALKVDAGEPVADENI